MNKLSKITDSDSRSFYVIKAFAMLSVIAAHLNNPINDSGILTKAVTNFWAAFSTVGVVSFFIMSGFFYHREAGDTIRFWNKKLKFAVFPWVIFSAATYTLSCFVTKKCSVFGYIKWMLGFGAWYYYMTVLILMYIIFKFIGQNDFLLWLCMIINFVAIIFTTFHSEPILPFITNFLNIFHWIGFFALGVLIRKYRFDRKLLKSKIPLFVCVGLFLIDCILIPKIKVYTYFHIFSLQYELTFFVILLYLGYYISSLKSKWVCGLVFIGKNTLFIYLTHMQVVQFIVNRFPNNLIKYIVSPFFGLLIMVVITFAIKFIAERTNCGKMLKYIGIT